MLTFLFLSDAHFFGADVRGADFSRANLDGADFRDISFDKTTKGLPLVTKF